MAFSAGVFTRLYNWINEGLAQPVEIAKLDAEVAGIATGLSNCILRDGTGLPTADIPWNSKKITGLAEPTATGDALSMISTSATMTLTGLTTSPTGTAYFSRAGNQVMALLPILNGTSNSTAMTMTGIPAAYQPSKQSDFICWVVDNGTASVGVGSVAASFGTIQFYKAGGGTPFTNSGAKAAGSGVATHWVASWYT